MSNDHYQNIVEEYLRSDRSVFVNPEFFLQLEENLSQPEKGTSWYVDLVAVDFRLQTVFLCEVTYSSTMSALVHRLAAWALHWTKLANILQRDAHIPAHFHVRPWVFVPASLITTFVRRFQSEIAGSPFTPVITPLEMTTPWQYCTWNRQGEKAKDGYGIPHNMLFIDSHLQTA